MEVLADIPFQLDTDALLASLRIDPGGERAGEIRELADAVRPVLRPKALYDVCYVEERSEDSVVLGGVRFTSRVLRVNLEEAERVFPYVVTCGREVVEAAPATDDGLLRYALDRIMEQALRAARGAFVGHVAERYRPGPTSAMSPGSLADWPMAEQRQLFALFGDVKGRIGVELTDSLLMVPIKSVSGILFPTEVRFESCQLCDREGCPGRRAPYEPRLWKSRYGRPSPSRSSQ
ncbi:MAG: vitamin B12 dependent-methionine synthase activation domain-containing protein [Candidatus Brocadiia bacterium]